MGNFSWIQFIQKKKQPIFFRIFTSPNWGRISFRPKRNHPRSKIHNSPPSLVRRKIQVDEKPLKIFQALPGRVKQHVSCHVPQTHCKASSNILTKTSSQKKIWSFHLHHLAAPLVAHLRAERHAESTRARWSRWRVRNFKANFTAVFGSLGTPIKLPGNMSCDRSNFSSITRLAALKKRGQFQGFHDHLLPCALSMFSASAEVLRLKQLKNS